MNCPACGHTLSQGARFCTKCGTLLSQRAPIAAVPVESTPAADTCSNCAKPMKPGARFCTACGTAVPVVAAVGGVIEKPAEPVPPVEAAPVAVIPEPEPELAPADVPVSFIPEDVNLSAPVFADTEPTVLMATPDSAPMPLEPVSGSSASAGEVDIELTDAFVGSAATVKLEDSGVGQPVSVDLLLDEPNVATPVVAAPVVQATPTSSSTSDSSLGIVIDEPVESPVIAPVSQPPVNVAPAAPTPSPASTPTPAVADDFLTPIPDKSANTSAPVTFTDVDSADDFSRFDERAADGGGSGLKWALIGLAIVAVLGAGGWFGYQKFAGSSSASVPADNAAPATSVAPAINDVAEGESVVPTQSSAAPAPASTAIQDAAPVAIDAAAAPPPSQLPPPVVAPVPPAAVNTAPVPVTAEPVHVLQDSPSAAASSQAVPKPQPQPRKRSSGNSLDSLLD